MEHDLHLSFYVLDFNNGFDAIILVQMINPLNRGLVLE
uniref:Uncharacterized protein n=1 Tax=Nelumbo nucifera TaxID=4432 RepID=A0A822ZEC6_NELNU|nr:TPA_asm: hypothetical protein HUJ06_016088 [Nelumbo nucifera]